MSQTAYNINQPEAFAGMKANAEFDNVESFAAETAAGIDFGITVAVGTDAVQQVKVPAAGETIRGIAVHKHVEKQSNGNALYAQNEAVDVLRKGKIWMKAATGNSLAVDGVVYANIDVASEEGYATHAAGSDNILIPTGVVRKLSTDPDGAQIALVEVNLP